MLSQCQNPYRNHISSILNIHRTLLLSGTWILNKVNFEIWNPHWFIKKNEYFQRFLNLIFSIVGNFTSQVRFYISIWKKILFYIFFRFLLFSFYKKLIIRCICLRYNMVFKFLLNIKWLLHYVTTILIDQNIRKWLTKYCDNQFQNQFLHFCDRVL